MLVLPFSVLLLDSVPACRLFMHPRIFRRLSNERPAEMLRSSYNHLLQSHKPHNNGKACATMSRSYSRYDYPPDVFPSPPLLPPRAGAGGCLLSHSRLFSTEERATLSPADDTRNLKPKPSIGTGRNPLHPLSSSTTTPDGSSPAALAPPPVPAGQPLFSHRIRRFQKQAHAGDKKKKIYSMRKLKAELGIAIGVETLVKEEQRRSRAQGCAGRKGPGVVEEDRDTLMGLFEELKPGAEEAQSGHHQGGQGGSWSGRGRGREAMEAAGGAATLTDCPDRTGAVAGGGVGGRGARAGESLNSTSSATSAASHDLDEPGHPLSFQPSRESSTRPSYPPSSVAGQSKIFLSSLTPAQHKTVQHAAAALLLKERGTGSEIERMTKDVLGGVEGVMGVLAKLGQKVQDGNRRTGRLFGTSLPYLTKHEGIDSYQGIDPHSTVRVPEFVDHCITALLQASELRSSTFVLTQEPTDRGSDVEACYAIFGELWILPRTAVEHEDAFPIRLRDLLIDLVQFRGWAMQYPRALV
ncbi:hypothetical protein JCM21900_000867 [Sporobolomyces salmonicolor]